jgi:hypothetical protein
VVKQFLTLTNFLRGNYKKGGKIIKKEKKDEKKYYKKDSAVNGYVNNDNCLWLFNYDDYNKTRKS